MQQALKRMHTQGMVVFSSKGHFSVPTFSEKEVCDIIEIRLLLEHQALTDIQRKALPVDYQTLESSGQGVHPLQRNGRCGQCPPHGPGLPPGVGGAGREPVSQRGL